MYNASDLSEWFCKHYCDCCIFSSDQPQTLSYFLAQLWHELILYQTM